MYEALDSIPRITERKGRKRKRNIIVSWAWWYTSVVTATGYLSLGVSKI
jgi:hypothetical protein